MPCMTRWKVGSACSRYERIGVRGRQTFAVSFCLSRMAGPATPSIERMVRNLADHLRVFARDHASADHATTVDCAGSLAIRNVVVGLTRDRRAWSDPTPRRRCKRGDFRIAASCRKYSPRYSHSDSHARTRNKTDLHAGCRLQPFPVFGNNRSAADVIAVRSRGGTALRAFVHLLLYPTA
jgi:hypothetical protein